MTAPRPSDGTTPVVIRYWRHLTGAIVGPIFLIGGGAFTYYNLHNNVLAITGILLACVGGAMMAPTDFGLAAQTVASLYKQVKP